VATAFSAACHEATGGNPFYLEALLREAYRKLDGAGRRELPRALA
jgi:hypothetical protein